MITNNNPRLMAVKTLSRVHDGAYSNLQLNWVINNSKMDHRDIALMTNIVYGVIQHRLTLNYEIVPFLKQPEKVKPWLMELLYSALYQMEYLTRVPKRAIFNESIKIAKQLGNDGSRKLVTGILHQMDRSGLPSFERIKDGKKKLSIQYSVPSWIIEQLLDQVGKNKTISILKSINQPSKQAIRVNQHLISIKDAIQQLKAQNYHVQSSQIAQAGLILSGKPVTLSSLFKTGAITIQDESAMLPVEALDIKGDSQVLDACAAPGGKTTQIAEKLNQGGIVRALDLHRSKIKKIDQNVKRMHLEKRVNSMDLDAKKVDQKFSDEQFDRILVDAPCSGLGLMQRKPEVRYGKKIDDVLRLVKTQSEILNAVARKLKHGGIMVYSTCTILNQENQNVIVQFVENHPEFKIEDLSKQFKFDHQINGYLKIFPDDYDSDGFFICKLRRE
nr:16S rRNA (cytosine(967)-C(5))-methyltransferase RsmB [Philodulcilactobacillus myokoensis]